MKHTFRKCLSLVLALATLLSVCVVPLAAADNECDHYAYRDQWTHVGKQEPTCLEYGGEAYLCGKCGERFVDKTTWVKPLGHDKVVVEEKAPTNKENGWRKYKCSRCDVPEWTEAWNYNRCANNACTFVAQPAVYLDANGVSDPCDQRGIVYNKCSKCGWMEIKEYVPAKGHNWKVTIVRAPVCGTPEVQDDPATPENEYKAEVKPIDAILAFSCSICGETKENEYVKSPNEHKLVWYDAVAPTCEKDGNVAGYKCEYCAYQNLMGGATAFVVPATGHDFDKQLTGNDYPTFAATCTNGQEWWHCKNANCDYKDGIVKVILDAEEVGYHAVPTGSNNSRLGNYKAHTCVVDGYWTCTVCYNKVYNSADPARHDWQVSEEADPTCTVQGYQTYLCTVCKYTYGINTPATGHKAPSTVNVVAATCTTPAYRWFICENANCPGENLDGSANTTKRVEIVIDGSIALGHIVPITGVVEHEATCGNKGWREYTCQRTGCPGFNCFDLTPNKSNTNPTEVKEYTDALPLAHEWKIIVPAVEATCVTDGAKAVIRCALCGDYDTNSCHLDTTTNTYVGNVVKASGHSYELKKDIPANCLYKKHDGYVCIECGHECLGGAACECVDPVNAGQYLHAAHDLSAYLIGENTGKHVYTKYSREVTTAPTCESTGLMRVYCDICAFEDDNVIIPALGHAYGSKPVGVVPATCNNLGFEVYYCAVCDTTLETNKFTLAAADRDRYESHYTGYTYFYDKFTGEFTLTPGVHETAVAVSTTEKGVTAQPGINTGKGSCTVHEYQVWICNNTGFKFVREVVDTNGHPWGSHVLVTSSMDAECRVSAGGPYNGYINRVTCARCTDSQGNATIIDKGVTIPWKHTYDPNQPINDELEAPTCTTPGVIENGYCLVCQADVKVAGTPLGHKNADGTLALEWVAASPLRDCVTDKYDAHWGCALCDYVVKASVLVEGKLPTKKDQNNKTVQDDAAILAGMVSSVGHADAGYNFQARTGHSFGATKYVDPACLVDGYTYHECDNVGCSEIEVTGYKLGYANHRFEDMHAAGEKVPECADYCYYCQNPTYKNFVVQTTVCNLELVVKEAKPHTNKYDIALVCTDWPVNTENKEAFYICKFCHDGNSKYADGRIVGDFTAGPEKCPEVHGDFDVVVVEASCTMPKHDLNTCTECSHVFIVRAKYDNTLIDHEYTKKKNEVYPTTWTGYYTYDLVCHMCEKDDGKETKEKLAEVYFNMSIANKYAGTVLVNGSRVTVTINMLTPATDIYSVSMAVKFNNKVLEWVDTKSTVSNVFGSGVTEVYCDNNGMDTVEIYAHAENSAAGKVQNVSVKGTQKLVTLEFEIKPTAYAKTEEAIKDAITFGDITVLQYDASVIGKEGYAIGDEFKVWKYDESATATDADKVKVATEVAYGGICYKAETNKGAYELVIWKLADLNKDGVVGAVDAGIMDELVLKTSGYDAQADLNKDGKVDTADFILMKQYMVEKLSYAELAKR
ncbi:MAG: hypothetical protein J6D31_08765 [Clostridia bacterium]|nr:hypothetical protein [Clostridia bacterium]